ncbi:hypothetical protein [Chitinophaga sp. RAB17]|uniref:hypothetical protein n=1 Tax=Chitinophaga sp. RAB17 TaxID=3233049 RepID=UPI003F8F4733
MTISTAVKKQITSSWLTHFPDLTAYSQNKLYKVLGPIVIGIELLSIPRSEDYRPNFVIYPLWKENEIQCLDMPMISIEIERKNGRPFDVPYADHTKLENEAFESTSKQIIPFDRNIPLHQLMLYAELAIQKSFPVPIAEANNYELRLFSAVYASDWPLTENILDELFQVGSNWNPAGFNFKFGSFEKWYKSLEEKVRNRDLFLSQISRNLEGPKLSKLKRSELLP